MHNVMHVCSTVYHLLYCITLNVSETCMCRIVNTLEMLADALDVNPGDEPVVSETDETVVQAEYPPSTASDLGYDVNVAGGIVISLAPGIVQTNNKIVTSVIRTTTVFPLAFVGGIGGLSITSVVVSMSVMGTTVNGAVTFNLAATFVSCGEFRWHNSTQSL